MINYYLFFCIFRCDFSILSAKCDSIQNDVDFLAGKSNTVTKPLTPKD